MKRKNFVGLLIIAIGILILLDRLEIVDGDILSRYWPMIIIAIGIINLFDKYSSNLIATIFILVGCMFQLRELELEIFRDIRIGEFIFPVIVIIVGLSFIFPKKKIFDRKLNNKKVVSSDTLDSICFFSAADIVNQSSNFQGGDLVTAFGGIDADLKNSNILGTDSIVINAYAIFGGIDIIVPDDWKVEVRGLPLFGGWSNKTRKYDNHDKNKVLIVKALVLFGGLEVKY